MHAETIAFTSLMLTFVVSYMLYLYCREAIEREGHDVLHDGNASMHALIDRLRVRRVAMAADYFLNINTAADLDAAQR